MGTLPQLEVGMGFLAWLARLFNRSTPKERAAANGEFPPIRVMPAARAIPSASVPQWLSEEVTIVYVDANGRQSERDIAIQRVWNRFGELYIQAYCFKREAPRSFVASRIRRLWDARTGEVFEDIQSFLQRHPKFDPTFGARSNAGTEAALERMKDEITVLAFAARANLAFVDDERSAIRDFVATRCGDLEIDRALLFACISAADPNEGECRGAMRRVKQRGAAALEDLARAVVGVLNADGVIDRDELAFLDEFNRMAAEGGLVIDRDGVVTRVAPPFSMTEARFRTLQRLIAGERLVKDGAHWRFGTERACSRSVTEALLQAGLIERRPTPGGGEELLPTEAGRRMAADHAALLGKLSGKIQEPLQRSVAGRATAESPPV